MCDEYCLRICSLINGVVHIAQGHIYIKERSSLSLLIHLGLDHLLDSSQSPPTESSITYQSCSFLSFFRSPPWEPSPSLPRLQQTPKSRHTTAVRASERSNAASSRLLEQLATLKEMSVRSYHPSSSRSQPCWSTPDSGCIRDRTSLSCDAA